jgi:Pectate lyase superfamily protein
LAATAAAFAVVLPVSALADCGAQDPRSFGATGNGCTDDRNAIQAAADAAPAACGGAGGYVALSPGRYRINSMVNLPPNVGMVGTSPMESRIMVSNQACAPNTGTFVMGDSAVIRLQPPSPANYSSAPAPLNNFGITFYQPDTSDRNAMIHYPVAIRADFHPYTRISNIWITMAWNGVSLLGDPPGTPPASDRGNSGGSSFDNIVMAAYNVGFDIDNAQDSMRFSRIECAWNNLMSQFQQAALASIDTICIRSGYVDDLHVTDSSFLLDTGL